MSKDIYSLLGAKRQPKTLADDKPRKRLKNLGQSYFNIGNRKSTCRSCSMSYHPHLKQDAALHTKFHNRCLNGREWSSGWGRVLETAIIDGSKAQIVEINIQNRAEVAAAKEILKMVNMELNAPEDTRKWLESPEKGKAFVLVLDKRAVGLVSIERIKEGKWLVLATGNVVPNQTLALEVGVSRIYVARNWRRKGIGLKLMETVEKFSIYGVCLSRTRIGWSQPSEFGSKLATKFNAVKHGSGKMLLPVYIEDDSDMVSES